MNKDLPSWVNLLRAILSPWVGLGNRCADMMTQLLDRHCRCELCKKDHRGAYRES